MAKSLILVSFLFFLIGCTPPLPASAFQPANPEFYTELPDQFFLKNKLVIGQVKNSYRDKDIITGEAYAQALKKIYQQSHLLTYVASQTNDNALLINAYARYTLDVEIVDYRITASGFTHVVAGSAVIYSLTDMKTEKEVYRKTVTATQDIKKNIFEDTAPVMTHALAESLGENAAQSVRELVQLSAADLGIAKILRIKREKKQ